MKEKIIAAVGLAKVHRKKLLIVLVCIVAALAAYTAFSYVSLKNNVVGNWNRESFYSNDLGKDMDTAIVINENGEYASFTYYDTTLSSIALGNYDNVTTIASGKYTVKPFKVVLEGKETSEKFGVIPNYTMELKYNPFTKRLYNNSIEYTKR